jgi:methenyltetrahydromethanopterin cyclohydrolase
VRARDVVVPSTATTAETYLGTARAAAFAGNEPLAGTHTYQAPGFALSLGDFAYRGSWTIGPQRALAGPGAGIEADVEAKNVYIVLSPPAHGAGSVAVTVDGAPTRTIAVTGQRLYRVASFATDSQHTIELRFAPGTSGYSFTFG